jgi:hypothetical protein
MAHIIRFDEGHRFDSGLRYGQLVPDSVPKKGVKIMADIIPRARALYRAWLVNLSAGVGSRGASFGLTAGQITAIQNTIAAQIALIDAVEAANSALQGAQEAEKTGRTTTDAILREEIADWKRAAGWTAETEAELRVKSSPSDFDPNTYKPEFTLRIVGGEIRIDWKKKGAHGIKVYSRLRGATAWNFESFDMTSPYIDGNPHAQPNVPEVREYMLRGVIDDVEIGLDSDIQSITWAGN